MGNPVSPTHLPPAAIARPRSRQPGRRSFIAGSVGLLLFGSVHLLAVYDANFNEPRSPAEVELRRAMRDLTFPMGPFQPSAWGALQILNSSYSVLLLYAGVVSLVALNPAIECGKLRALTVVSIALAAALLAITVVYQFPPPMVFAAALLALFVVSLTRQISCTRSRTG